MSDAISANQNYSIEQLILQGTTISTRMIYEIIVLEERIQAKILFAKTPYSSRTVRTSLKVLLNLGLIKQIPNLEDMRSHFYEINQNYKL